MTVHRPYTTEVESTTEFKKKNHQPPTVVLFHQNIIIFDVITQSILVHS